MRTLLQRESRIIALLAKHQRKYFPAAERQLGNEGEKKMDDLNEAVQAGSGIEYRPTSSNPLYGTSPQQPSSSHPAGHPAPETEKDDEEKEQEEEKKKKKEEEEKKKQQPHPGSSGGSIPGSGTPSGGYSPQR